MQHWKFLIIFVSLSSTSSSSTSRICSLHSVTPCIFFFQFFGKYLECTMLAKSFKVFSNKFWFRLVCWKNDLKKIWFIWKVRSILFSISYWWIWEGVYICSLRALYAPVTLISCYVVSVLWLNRLTMLRSPASLRKWWQGRQGRK